MVGLRVSAVKFNKEIKEFADLVVPKEVIRLHKKISLEALKRIVRRTPVKTGLARNSWILSLRNPSEATLQTVDPTGERAISRAARKLEDIPPFTLIYIQSNLNYIEFLESGTSTQAPQGMVAITFAELQTTFR